MHLAREADSSPSRFTSFSVLRSPSVIISTDTLRQDQYLGQGGNANGGRVRNLFRTLAYFSGVSNNLQNVLNYGF